MSPFNMTRPPFLNDDNASEPANETAMPANFADDGWAYASYMAQPPAPFTAHMPSVPADSMRDSGFGNLPANYSQTDPAIGSFIGRGVSTTPTGYSASDTFVHGSMDMPEIGSDTYGVPQLTTPGITTYPGVVKGGILSQATYAASRSTVRSDPHSTPYAGVTGSAMETLTETYDMSHSPAFAGGTPVSTYVDARDVSQPVADSYLAPSTTSYTGEKDVFERGTHTSTYTDVHRVPQRVAHPVYHTTPPVGPAGGHTNSHANTHDVPRPPACAEPRTTSYPGALDGGSAAGLAYIGVDDICQPAAYSMFHTVPSVGPAGSHSVPMYVHENGGFQPRAYPEPRSGVFNGSCAPMSTRANMHGAPHPVAYSRPDTTMSAGPAGSDGAPMVIHMDKDSVFQSGVYPECRPDVIDGSRATMPTHASVHGAPQPVAYPTHLTTPPAGPSGGHSGPRANTHNAPQTDMNPSHRTPAPAGARDGADGSKVAHSCPWCKCDLPDDGEPVQRFRSHFRSRHVEEIDERDESCCPHDGCQQTPMKSSNIPRHVVGVHWKALQVRCKRCRAPYARQDSLDRHICSRAASHRRRVKGG